MGLYTSEYLACWKSQREYVMEQLAASEGPIIDLASGRCYMVEDMARRWDRLIVATDFSPRVLRRDQEWLQVTGVLDRISLLAFDARHTPFKPGTVAVMTSNLGMQNIEEPGALLQELRRIVDGRFLAVSHFCPEDDETNSNAIRDRGLTALLRRQLFESFVSAGWTAEAVNSCTGRAHPTPTSALLDGAGIDTFRVAETTLEWCVIDAY